MKIIAALILTAALVLASAPAEADEIDERAELGGHRSAFVCAGTTIAPGATRYVLDRSNDGRIVEKNAEGIYIERRDGSGWWRTLARDEIRVVIWSQAPLRAVHGLGVNMQTYGYGRVVDLPKNDNDQYIVPTNQRVRPDVFTADCAP